jgi:hypothetical protein
MSCAIIQSIFCAGAPNLGFRESDIGVCTRKKQNIPTTEDTEDFRSLSELQN